MKSTAPVIMVVALATWVSSLTVTIADPINFDNSYALVVGIDQYRAPDWPPLKHAVKDGQAMAAFLADQGFTVTALYDQQATRAAILNHLNEILAHKVTDQDRVIIFFAGHGGTSFRAGRDHGFIVPVDGGSGFASNIQMDELRTAALMMDRARHILFIMDACYGGLLSATRASKIADGHPAYLEEITRRKARQVLTAGGADQQVADGGPGGHSQFTYHLLEALNRAQADLNGDRYITFAELAAYIVPKAYTFRQTPTYSTLAGHGLGEFVFLSAASPSVRRSAPTPAPIASDQTRGTSPAYPEVLSLISEFFSANNNEDIDGLLAVFSSKVDYFNWGPTRPHRIRKDKEYFFTRWTDVEYTPIGEPEVVKTDTDQFRVAIKFDFYVRNMQRCEGKHGESSFVIQVQKILGQWKITAIKEDVYFRDSAFDPC